MKNATTVRCFWETMTCRPGKRLVREWVDAKGHIVAFLVVCEVAS